MFVWFLDNDKAQFVAIKDIFWNFKYSRYDVTGVLFSGDI